MLWLQSPAWGRRIAAAAIVLVALFVEFRPTPLTEHPFLTAEVAAGEEIGDWNTEMREVPVGLLEEIVPSGAALRPIAEGEPLLQSMLAMAGDPVPDGWWTIEIELPDGTSAGTSAQLVLLDSGDVVDAVVVSEPVDDTFGSSLGSVAVAPESAVATAVAAANGEIAVMTSPA